MLHYPLPLPARPWALIPLRVHCLAWALIFWGCLGSTPRIALAEELFRLPSADFEGLQTTLQQVRELRAGGELAPAVIQLPPGRYEIRESLQLTPAEVGRGLTFQAEKAGETRFSGSVTLLTRGRDEQGRWRYPLPAELPFETAPRVLILNGAATPAARYPQADYFRIEKSLPDRRSGFVIQANDAPTGLDLAAGHCDLILLHDWSSSRLPVAEYDAATRTLRTVGPIGCSAPHYAIDHFEKQPRYWLEGHPSFATAPGDWYLDRSAGPQGEIVLLPGKEQGDSPPDVSLPWTTELLTAVGTPEQPLRNLAFEGIVFADSRFPMPSGGLAGAQATMHEPRDESGERTTQHRPMLDAAVRVEHADGCRFRNCRFERLGATGLWLAANTRNCVVQRCRFHDLGGNALNVGEDNSRHVNGKPWYQSVPEQVPTNNRVEQCRIDQCGTILPGAVAIWAPFNRGLKIVDNHIHDCPYTGISLGWMWNPTPTPARENLIQGNRIEFVMQVLSDGGGIYTLGNQPDSLITGNVITDVPLNAGRAESNGMFLDEGTTGFTIQGNTIRRIDRSPLRFHKAGENRVLENAWELATSETPPVRFNNTPAENISISDNTVLEPQRRILLIGNSLTWDTIPSRLEEAVHWHVDCGKPLTYIYANPENPCVQTSRLWPTAMRTVQYDLISVQPHYGTTLEEDLEIISRWVKMQPRAVFVIHTGWARHANFAEEAADTDPAGPLTHSDTYFDALLKKLRERHPDREFRSSRAMNLLFQIQADIENGTAPLEQLSDLYRDAIHMHTGPGRYLMHNQMRKTLGQPRLETGFPEFAPELKTYLDTLLDQP